MHIECRACGWKQGEFWSVENNPVRTLADLEDILLTGRLDQSIGGSTTREEAVEAAKRAAVAIKNTKWRTLDEYKYDRNASCPVCGSTLKLTVVS